MNPDLLRVVGHELRGPLAAMLVSAELALDGLDELDHQQLVRLLTTLQLRVRGLQALVDNLLHSEASGHQLVRKPLSADELVADVRLTVEPLLMRRGQTLQVTGAGLIVVADRGRLVQVLVNLILNASKFSAPDTTIELEFHQRGGSIVVEVADRGIGLPPGPTAWLFEPAARWDHSATGVGLGLAIVRSIVEAHGGRVYAANRPGGGARFRFTLPRADIQSRVSQPTSRPDTKSVWGSPATARR